MDPFLLRCTTAIKHFMLFVSQRNFFLCATYLLCGGQENMYVLGVLQPSCRWEHTEFTGQVTYI